MEEKNLVQKKKEGGGNQLTRRRAKYLKSYADYAIDYRCTDRTIKSWVHTGKKKNDLPPLDDAVAMGLWLARYLPGKLAGGVRPQKPPSFDVPPAGHRSESRERQPDGLPPLPRDFSGVRSLTIEQNVEELRHTLAVNKQLLDEAMRGTDENMISLRQRNYKDVFELLRKAEDTLAKLREQSGDLIDKQIVRAEIGQALELLRLQRETMPRRIMTELERILPRKLSRTLRAGEKFLTAAVDKVRIEEENIFRNLENVGSRAAAASAVAAA